MKVHSHFFKKHVIAIATGALFAAASSVSAQTTEVTLDSTYTDGFATTSGTSYTGNGGDVTVSQTGQTLDYPLRINANSTVQNVVTLTVNGGGLTVASGGLLQDVGSLIIEKAVQDKYALISSGTINAGTIEVKSGNVKLANGQTTAGVFNAHQADVTLSNPAGLKVTEKLTAGSLYINGASKSNEEKTVEIDTLELSGKLVLRNTRDDLGSNSVTLELGSATVGALATEGGTVTVTDNLTTTGESDYSLYMTSGSLKVGGTLTLNRWAQIGTAGAGSDPVLEVGTLSATGQSLTVHNGTTTVSGGAEIGTYDQKGGTFKANNLSVTDGFSIANAKLEVTDTLTLGAKGTFSTGSDVDVGNISAQGQLVQISGGETTVTGKIEAQKLLLHQNGGSLNAQTATVTVDEFEVQTLKPDSGTRSIVIGQLDAGTAAIRAGSAVSVKNGATVKDEFATYGELTVDGDLMLNGTSYFEAGSTTKASQVVLNAAGYVKSAIDTDMLSVNNNSRLRLQTTNLGNISDLVVNSGEVIATQEAQGGTLNKLTWNSTDSEDFFQTYSGFTVGEMVVNGTVQIETYPPNRTEEHDIDLKIDNLTVNSQASVRFDNPTQNDASSVEVGTLTLAENAKVANTTDVSSSSGLYPAFKQLSFEKVNSSGGVLENAADGKIQIGTLEGTSLDVLVADEQAKQITIVQNNAESVTIQSSNPDYGNQMTSVDGAVKALAGTVGFTGNDVNVLIAANDMTGEINATVNDKNEIQVLSEDSNPVNQTLAAVASLPVVAWRAELNDLYKRLGDLRSSPNDSGAWVRYNGGKLEWDAGNVDNTFHMIQVGVDTRPVDTNVRLGVAFSYTRGDADYTGGSADLDTYSLAAYGSWLGDAGQYVDVVGRIASIKNDAQAASLTGQGLAYEGTMDNIGLSMSVEGGWRFDLPMNFFVDPQAELTYSYLTSDSFEYDGRKYELQSTDSLIGRLGFLVGLKCPNNRGSVYLRASVVHDFLGESDVTVSNGLMSRTSTNDFGGTWGEFGIGANLSISESTYLYADIEHTAGGEIEEPWRVNLGLRYSF